MANAKTMLSHQKVFFNKKLFSNKIHARVLKVSIEISKALDKLKIENDEDKQSFLNAVNHYYRDLCTVIFHVRQVVIKIDSNDQGVCDLQDIITELNKIVLHIQESLNLETEKLINQLKDIIADVCSQVENLMRIIECDNLHEYKQNVLDCQHDLVISAEALKLYCQFAYLSPPELERFVRDKIQKIKNNLVKINTGHEHLAEEFAHYTRHSVNNFQNAANYLQKMINTQNFQDYNARGLKIAAGCSAEVTGKLLEALYGDNSMRKMLDAIENCHKMVIKSSSNLQNVVQCDRKQNIEEKDNEQAKQLMSHVFINGINSMSAWNQSIEDAIKNK